MQRLTCFDPKIRSPTMNADMHAKKIKENSASATPAFDAASDEAIQKIKQMMVKNFTNACGEAFLCSGFMKAKMKEKKYKPVAKTRGLTQTMKAPPQVS